MMAHMTQTQTPPRGGPDPDRHPDPARPDPDPGLDPTQTQTRTHVPTQTRPDPAGLSLGPGLESERHLDPDPDSDYRPSHASTADKITPTGPGPSPNDTQTPIPTRTRTQTAARRSPRAANPDEPTGWRARRRIARAARDLAEQEAIDQAADEWRLAIQMEEAAVRDGWVSDDADEPGDDEKPARWEKFAAGWPQWALTVVVSIMASVGQIQFAKENGAVGMIEAFGRDITPWFAPAVFDFSVAGLFAFGMFVAVRYKASPWLPWIAGTAIGCVSIYTNTQHKGALFFATSSAVLLVSWMVRLIVKYRHLPHVKAQRAAAQAKRASRRATAKPRLLTSSLIFASRPTAFRAWVIARRRPIAACAASMNENGQDVTERDLVIRVAELFISVYADRTVFELEQLGDPPQDDKEMKTWEAKREQALNRAELVAWDAVDNALGIPVIDRMGIKVNPLTYVEPVAPPAPRALKVASAAAPAAPAITAAPAPAAVTAPASRPGIAAAPAPAPAPDVIQTRPAAPRVVLMPGQPAGMAGVNWLPLAELPGLPVIDPSAPCRCKPAPKNGCGNTLLDHVQRRGKQILPIITQVPDWDRRTNRIGKDVVKEVCDAGSSTQMEVSWLFDQLRALALEQREAKNAAASGGTVVTAEVIESAEVPEA